MNLPQTSGTPAAETPLDESLVRDLLADQHPDLAPLPLVQVDAGWDNVMVRLGERLAVRMPRRALAAQLIVHEQRWLPQFAERLPLPIPAPVRVGEPGRGYPWPWSVVPWHEGRAADEQRPARTEAPRLAQFLRILHQPAPAEAPRNPFRDVPLAERAPLVEQRLHRLAEVTKLITPRVTELWHAAVEAPIDVPPTWIHGDLHPRNLLVTKPDDGARISAVIDWGDLTSADRAVDLASFWMLFEDANARQTALAEYGGASEGTIARAVGWAIFYGATLLDTGLVDHPRHARLGERILSQVANGA